MSTFGTVVPGVGTFHAPLISGGCAAMMQSASSSLNVSVAGGIAGASVGSSLSNSNSVQEGKEGECE